MISAYAITETRPQPKEIVSVPPSTVRKAICGGVHQADHTTTDYHEIRDSSKDLAFFEYRGLGSKASTVCLTCHFYESGHDVYGLVVAGEHSYSPHGPWEYDGFYCGHSGWD